MVEQAGSPAYEADGNLADSRAQFVGSLGRRLEALRQALSALEESPRSSAHRDHLRRRIHAFGAAAGVLGFERVFEAFREAETVLGNTGPSALGPAELGLIARTVDLVPSLVLGGAGPDARGAGIERRAAGYPTSVLVFGAAPLAESLVAAATSGGASLECERTEDPARAEEIVRAMAPDVAVIDADRRGARELMETLAYDPLLDPVRIIAVGSFDRPEAAADLVALGVARVLPKPVSPEALKRSVLEVAREHGAPPQRVEPLGDTTVEALADRLSQELRRGLVDAMKPQGRGASVALGEGTDVLAAVWSSVARIRELVTLRSGGAIRFESTGPEGAVPLAPWMGDDRSRATLSGEKRSSDGVSLEGRVLVVADDDPSVVWFLAGLFRAAGAVVLEAHDGRRALELTRASWPDVVVSDILMPKLDGFALCREIKRDIALSDTPVVLLSWKEDLLQRVRELGADADGYLRKEATASTVVQRLKEVLLPRARVEARVAAGAIARGRLDGLTPRLVLDVTCKHGQNVHLTVRDAAFLYEVDVRDGRVRNATRTASDGRAESGERALATLLGVRAGRFAVRRDVSECPRDWDLDLKELLDAPIERARAARGLLGDARKVARVEMDAAAIEPYLAATPTSVRVVAERLADGESPENVLGSGVSAALLESVLTDAVLHGAVQRLVGRNGEDLLVKEIEAERSARAVFARQPKTVSTPAQVPLIAELAAPPEPLADLPALSPVPGQAARDEDTRLPFGDAQLLPPAGAGPSPFEEVLSPASSRLGAHGDDFSNAKEAFVPAEGTSTFEAVTGPRTMKGLGESKGDGFESLLVDSSPPPADATTEDRQSGKPKTTAPILSAPAGPSPLESAVLSIAAPTSARSRFTSSIPPPSSDKDSNASPFTIERKKALESTSAKPASDEAAVDLGTAVAAFGEASESPPKVEDAQPKDAIAEPQAHPAERESPSVTEATAAAHTAEPVEAASVAEPRTVTSETARTDATAEPAEVARAVPAAEATKGDEPAPSLTDAPKTVQVVHGGGPADATSEDASGPISGPRPLTGRPPTVDVETPREGARTAAMEALSGVAIVDGQGAVADAAKPDATPALGAAKSDTKRSALQVDENGEVRAPRAPSPIPAAGTPAVPGNTRITRKTTPKSAGRPEPKATEGGFGGTVGIVVVVCIAAFSSFSIVRAIRGGSADKDPVAASSVVALPAAGSTPAPPSSVVPLAPPMMAVKDMDLPLGLAVDADRGLLEIEISETQNLFVDGVLIGPGPFRQLPLREGTRLLKIQGDGVDVSRHVEIRKGRRVRIGITSSR